MLPVERDRRSGIRHFRVRRAGPRLRALPPLMEEDSLRSVSNYRSRADSWQMGGIVRMRVGAAVIASSIGWAAFGLLAPAQATTCQSAQVGVACATTFGQQSTPTGQPSWNTSAYAIAPPAD